MTQLKSFTIATARPLPVILLVDVSGSMEANGKISAVNKAVADMIRSFEEEDSSKVEIQMAIITFGGEKATLFQDIKPVSEIIWEDMKPAGRTPMGAAFRMATQLIEDRQKIPSRAYTPSIVLASDGIPTDNWEESLSDLFKSERASKADRFAMAIGDDANEEMLKAFLNEPSSKVFLAHEAPEIHKFFRWVTMSVTDRSKSNNPNKIESTEPDDFDY